MKLSSPPIEKITLPDFGPRPPTVKPPPRPSFYLHISRKP